MNNFKSEMPFEEQITEQAKATESNQSNIQIFESLEFGIIRTIRKNGKVIFCGKDVASALGYEQPHKAVERHCRYGMKCTVPHPQSKDKTIEMIFIPEGDVYRLITHSKLPNADRFEQWVFDDVLPEIRRTGGYIPSSPNDTDDDIMAKALLIANRKIKEKEKIIKGLQEDSKYLKEIIDNPSLVTITQIAKDYGMSGKKLNDTLHQLKIQYKQNGQWLLYSSYQDKGYTHSKTIAFKHSDDRPDTKMITEWTQNGRKFLYEMLKSISILPLIEKYGEQVSIPNSKNIQA